MCRVIHKRVTVFVALNGSHICTAKTRTSLSFCPFKVTGNTFTLPSSSTGGQFLKERIFSSEHNFSFKNGAPFGRASFTREANRKS